MRTMQSFSWKRPCCSAFPPLSRRLTNKPRVLKRSETSVSGEQIQTEGGTPRESGAELDLTGTGWAQRYE